MRLENLLKQGNLARHKTSEREIEDVLSIIERDLKDASLRGLSPDRRFITAYNAILQEATVLLHLQGFRARGEGHHYFTFEALRGILGRRYEPLMDYFQACRDKRNISDYDRAGIVTETEVMSLLREAKKFNKLVRGYVSRGRLYLSY